MSGTLKRKGTSRLLTGDDMQRLQREVWLKDDGCLLARAHGGHTCGSPRPQLGLYGILEAHHVIEQSWIKQQYKRGGRWIEDEDRYMPWLPTELVLDVDITARDIAADPEVCICLCGQGHDDFPKLKPARQLDVVDPIRESLANAIKRYSMTEVLRRHQPMFTKGLGL